MYLLCYGVTSNVVENVVSSIDSGCSDVVQDGKISLEIADAAW